MVQGQPAYDGIRLLANLQILDDGAYIGKQVSISDLNSLGGFCTARCVLNKCNIVIADIFTIQGRQTIIFH